MKNSLKTIIILLVSMSHDYFWNRTLTAVAAETTTTTTTSSSFSSACPTKCDDCGSRAVRCVSDLSKCPITCECREGYSGVRCDVIENALVLKRHVWSQMLNESLTHQHVISFSSYLSLIKRLGDLVVDLTSESTTTRQQLPSPLDLYDIDQIGKIVEQIWRLNERRRGGGKYPNSRQVVETLLTIADRLLTLPSSSLQVGQSIRSVLERIDRLAKFFTNDDADGNDQALRVSLNVVDALVVNVDKHASATEWIELKSRSHDSISLNRQLVLDRLEPSDRPIRAVLKIYSFSMVSLINIKTKKYCFLFD